MRVSSSHVPYLCTGSGVKPILFWRVVDSGLQLMKQTHTSKNSPGKVHSHRCCANPYTSHMYIKGVVFEWVSKWGGGWPIFTLWNNRIRKHRRQNIILLRRLNGMEIGIWNAWKGCVGPRARWKGYPPMFILRRQIQTTAHSAMRLRSAIMSKCVFK